MYLENFIIKAEIHNNTQSRWPSQLKEYFFLLKGESALNPLSPTIFCTYCAQKYVFAQLLGFTSFFMCDLIISYRWVCWVWIRGVAREIRKDLKMRNGKMFEKVMQGARAGAYLLQQEWKRAFSNIFINMIRNAF